MLVALTFSPSDFEYLIGKAPFRMILDASGDDLDVYEDLCAVGQSLLDKRRLAQPPGACRSSELRLPKRCLEAETRQLCNRAEKNIRTGRALLAKTHLLIRQTRGLADQAHAHRKQLGAVLSELLWPPDDDDL